MSCLICTAAVAVLMGKIRVFLDFVKEVNPSIVTTHCFLHKEMFVMSTVNEKQLEQVLRTIVA